MIIWKIIMSHCLETKLDAFMQKYARENLFIGYAVTLILSFEFLIVNLELVKLVIFVRMDLCVERKWIWKHFPLGTSVSVGGLCTSPG